MGVCLWDGTAAGAGSGVDRGEVSREDAGRGEFWGGWKDMNARRKG